MNESASETIWERLAARLSASAVSWRQQGKATSRDGKWFAPFCAFTDAQFVRERLDAIVSGEWDMTFELLPTTEHLASGDADEPVAFKCRLQILGVIREDVGCGRDYKNAATDAFKRAAMRFGIGHELYTDYDVTWVQVDGDGKYAKALEDPATVFARKSGRPVVSAGNAPAASQPTRSAPPQSAPSTSNGSSKPQPPIDDRAPVDEEEQSCPKCGGKMWDNRIGKRNPKAPDFKCRQRSCDGVIWPPKASALHADGPPSDFLDNEMGF